MGRKLLWRMKMISVLSQREQIMSPVGRHHSTPPPTQLPPYSQVLQLLFTSFSILSILNSPMFLSLRSCFLLSQSYFHTDVSLTDIPWGAEYSAFNQSPLWLWLFMFGIIGTLGIWWGQEILPQKKNAYTTHSPHVTSGKEIPHSSLLKWYSSSILSK